MKPQAAVLLVRISDAREHGGDRELSDRKVKRDIRAGKAHAKSLGWEVAHVVVENDTSAYKRKMMTLPDGSKGLRVDRPELRRVLAMIASGEVDGVLATDLDRTTRDPRDLEDLIDAVEARTPRLPVESISGSLRLANDADVTMARIMVAVANKSSRDTARRIKIAHQEKAAKGEWAGGRRRYGFAPNGVTHVPAEVKTIQWLADRIIEGHTVRSLALQLDAAGTLPAGGGRWAGKTITDVLTSPRAIGLRTHHGQVVGEAVWAPILTPETQHKVKVALAVRAGAPPKELTYWLAQILYCGKCGTPMVSNTGGKARPGGYYICNIKKGCGAVTVTATRVEAHLAPQVVGYVEKHRAVLLGLLKSSAAAPVVLPVEASAEVLEDQALLGDLALMMGRKLMSPEAYAVAAQEVMDRITAAQPKVIAPPLPAHVRPVLERLLAGDAAGVWEGLSATDRRATARAVLAVQQYAGWTVAPHTKRALRFDAERLTLRAA